VFGKGGIRRERGKGREEREGKRLARPLVAGASQYNVKGEAGKKGRSPFAALNRVVSTLSFCLSPSSPEKQALLWIYPP
jgi:hypothetical protein